MKVKQNAEKQVAVPKREINIDQRIQEQDQKVKQAELQLAFEQGRLRSLIELISPPMTQPTSEINQ